MNDPPIVILPPIIRTTLLARIAFGYGAFFALAFAIALGVWGSTATSPQWRYLMETLGGHRQWVILYAAAAALTLYGLVYGAIKGVKRTPWWAIATGMFLTGTGCLLIATLYLLAPVFDSGLFTLGWFPWMVGCSSVQFFLAVIASRPFEVM